MLFLFQNQPINEALITAARQSPHQIGLVKLSKTQLKVLNAIKTGEQVTASQIASRCDISPSFASTLLRRLFDKGYVLRSSGVRKVGGVEFFYYLIE